MILSQYSPKKDDWKYANIFPIFKQIFFIRKDLHLYKLSIYCTLIFYPSLPHLCQNLASRNPEKDLLSSSVKILVSLFLIWKRNSSEKSENLEWISRRSIESLIPSSRNDSSMRWQLLENEWFLHVSVPMVELTTPSPLVSVRIVEQSMIHILASLGNSPYQIRTNRRSHVVLVWSDNHIFYKKTH